MWGARGWARERGDRGFGINNLGRGSSYAARSRTHYWPAWARQAGSSRGSPIEKSQNALKNQGKLRNIAFRPKGVRISDFLHSWPAIERVSGRRSGHAARATALNRLGLGMPQAVMGWDPSGAAATPSTWELYRSPTVREIGLPDTFWPKNDFPRFSAVFKKIRDFSMDIH